MFLHWMYGNFWLTKSHILWNPMAIFVTASKLYPEALSHSWWKWMVTHKYGNNRFWPIPVLVVIKCYISIYIYTVYPTIEDRIRMYAILCWHYPSCLLLPSCDLYWCLRGSNKWVHVWCHETEHTQRYPTVPNNQALTNTHKNTRKTAKENSWLLEPEKIFSNWGEY